MDGTALQAKLVDGVTTEKQARALFGEPGNIQLRDRGETEWAYKEASSSLFLTLEMSATGRLDRNSHTITPLFNQRGVLIRHAVAGY